MVCNECEALRLGLVEASVAYANAEARRNSLLYNDEARTINSGHIRMIEHAIQNAQIARDEAHWAFADHLATHSKRLAESAAG